MKAADQGGVEHVVQLLPRPEVRTRFENLKGGPETDDRIIREIRLHRSLGLKTQLKPHLWMMDGSWRGQIHRLSRPAWDAFFEIYQAWILRYARLAKAEGVGTLGIGVELDQTVVELENQWRRLLLKVRREFDGELTYASN